MADEHANAGDAEGEGHQDALAQALLDIENDWPQAIATLKAAVSGRDGDPVLNAKLAASLLELGRRLVQAGSYDSATEILNLGIEVAPLLPELIVQLGYAHLSRGDFASARTAFLQALEILPGTHDALFGLAKVHQELGEDEPAARYFRDYLTDRPNDSGAWLNLGHCLLGLGRLDAGYECFRRAARGAPERYGTALLSLAAAGRGRFWLRPSDAAAFFRLQD